MITTIAAIRALTGTLPSNYFYTTDRYQEGHWYYDASAPGTVVDNTGTFLKTADGKVIRRAFDSEINAKWFGAVGNGTTDDTDAIKKFIAVMLGSTVTDPAGGDPMARIYGYLPAGTYLITETDVLIPYSVTSKSLGYVLRGDGPGLTQIIFDPAGTGTKYLMSNRSKSEIQISGITFNSSNTVNPNSFCFSDSINPVFVQRISFDFCKWTGTWDNAFYLQGTNLNSEWSFTDCGVSGTMGTFMNTPSSGSSDQFLNFWFTRMKFWPTGTTGSKFIDFAKGGSISIVDSDFSGLNAGTLFNLRGTSHSRGVERFECRDSRFELKDDSCSVLYSEWSSGTVMFTGCDFGSQANNYSKTATLLTLNYPGLINGPAYTFQNCVMIGKVVVSASSTEEYRLRNSIKFDGCSFLQYRFIEEAFSFTNPATNNRGRVPVKIVNCIPGQPSLTGTSSWASSTAYVVGDQVRRRAPGTTFDKLYRCMQAGTSDASSSSGPLTVYNGIVDGTVIWDFMGLDTRYMATTFTMNWANSLGAVVEKNAAAITGNSYNIGAYNSTTAIMLPAEAVITAVRFYSPVGAVAQTSAASFIIKTGEATPTEFLNFTIANYSSGDYKEWNGFFNCAKDNGKRLIIVEPQADVTASNGTGQVIIEYLA